MINIWFKFEDKIQNTSKVIMFTQMTTQMTTTTTSTEPKTICLPWSGGNINSIIITNICYSEILCTKSVGKSSTDLTNAQNL